MIDAFFTAMDPHLNDALGSETATLRRALRLARPDGSPASDLLVVDVSLTVGSTSIELRSAAGALSGYVGKGLSVSVGGDSYLVAKDCAAREGTVVVHLASPLLAGAVEGDQATIPETEDWALPSCLAYSPREGVVRGDLADRVAFAVSVPVAVAPQMPVIGDAVTCSLGSGSVLGFLPSDGGSREVLVGSAKGIGA